jgi:hypothetical protein
LVVSAVPGHSSTAFTMDVYGHGDDDMLRPVADALGS